MLGIDNNIIPVLSLKIVFLNYTNYSIDSQTNLDMKSSAIVIATIITFLGTIFCGSLMTLPNVFASDTDHCEPSEHHHTQQPVPCHGDNTAHDHHQLDVYSLQKSELHSIAVDISVQSHVQQPLPTNIRATSSLSRQKSDMHERWRHRLQQIRTKQKE